MSAQGRPLGGRLLASMRGRVPVEDLRPHLLASAGAYDDFLAAEALRHELADAGITPWSASPAETTQLVCAWNAYALRTLADMFVSAETGSSVPGEGAYLARVTAQQVSLLLADVPAWSARARRAAVDPGYDVAAEAPLPAQLTAWVEVEPCPRSHLEAMRAGTSRLLEQVEGAFADLERLSKPAEAGAVGRLRGLVIDLQTRTGAAALGSSGAAGAAAHEAAEARLRDGAARCFALGQLLARPRLLDRPARFAPQRPGPRPPRYDPYGGHGHGGHHGGHH